MVVRKRFGLSPASNKPPPSEPEPGQYRYPIKKVSVEGDPVWVSVPQVDTISIVGNLLPEHFVSGYEVEASEQYGQRLMSSLASGKLGLVAGKPKYHSNIYWQVSVLLGEPAVAINFSLGKAKGDVVHWFRLEFNPNALGHTGTLDLLDGIHLATDKTFRIGRFLQDARVSRIDVAIDVVGLTVPDIIVSAVNEGKRVLYHGEDGILETVYVHRKSKAKTASSGKHVKLPALILRLYDKGRELSSRSLPAMFGETPVTRLEITKVRFGNAKFTPAQLGGLRNVFSAVRTNESRATAFNRWIWLEYVSLRRSGGHGWASQLLALSPEEGPAFDAAYTSFPSDLINPKDVWAFWERGLKLAGCDLLSLAAEAGSSASHITDHIGFFTDP